VNRRTTALILLAVAAALFGMTFVAVKDALDAIPPLSFVGWRFLIGAVVLLALSFPKGRPVWRDGAIAGGILFIGYAAQTVGLEQTTATNSGLITGLYVVFTPLLAAAFARLRPAASTVFGASLSVLGLGMLTISDTFTLSTGDLWTLACAVAFALHIVALARMAPRHDVIAFTAVQLLVTAVAALVLSAVFEGAGWPPRSVWLTLALTALVVTCGAFLVQVWAQTIIGPSRTAIVLALEPLFAVATAAVILGERLTARGWAGAVFMMVGTYVVLVFAPPEDVDIRTAEALSEAH
jgi:drug/metabolite transporter (DMT)-like permease